MASVEINLETCMWTNHAGIYNGFFRIGRRDGCYLLRNVLRNADSETIIARFYCCSCLALVMYPADSSHKAFNTE